MSCVTPSIVLTIIALCRQVSNEKISKENFSWQLTEELLWVVENQGPRKGTLALAAAEEAATWLLRHLLQTFITLGIMSTPLPEFMPIKSAG